MVVKLINRRIHVKNSFVHCELIEIKLNCRIKLNNGFKIVDNKFWCNHSPVGWPSYESIEIKYYIIINRFKILLLRNKIFN